MEDLNKMLELSEFYPRQLENMTEVKKIVLQVQQILFNKIYFKEFLLKLRLILWGQAAVATANKEKKVDELSVTASMSPQQTKKRAKRLSLLTEDTETESE